MVTRRILVVDDEPGMLEVCADTLRHIPQTQIVTERRSRRAAEILGEETFDLMISDIRMPDIDGVELLKHARECDPNLIVLMLTAYPTVETAVAAMKLGASDYITKPFLPEELEATVHRLLQEKKLREENRLLQRQLERPFCFDEIVSHSAPMRAIFDTIDRVAETDVDVLIVGETGVGKELVARSIHKRSRRSSARFVPVDCGAIPDHLLESELFGHEKGAFTGAHSRSLGLIEFAHHGSFFLDEVGELPLRLQAKLRRVLQERRVRRVGGKEEIDVDVRVVAATNRDLLNQIKNKAFREDLYYRINVVRIEIPSLRERLDDIPLLVYHFLKRFASEMEKPVSEVSQDVMEVLTRYSWPGNIRELQNVMKRSIALTRNEVLTVEDLPEEVVGKSGDQPAARRGNFFDLRTQHLAIFEQNYLEELLGRWNGDVTRAAQEAQLPRGTFYRLLKKHGLSADSFRQ
ncbi:MAG: sigma-54-dependent Fis family transcriptional regulator [Candidatus Schekmanbacteria bacterium]|nr:sigma-54-dependent Fis family transcriptional regulator [Candidatus Schekmanbacteria bacterium]